MVLALPKLADCGLRTDAAAAETAGVADAAGDAAGTGNPWEVRRADAKLFWRFFESFLMSMVLMLKALSCKLSMRIYYIMHLDDAERDYP